MRKTYTETPYYQIRLTARYIKAFSSQLFDRLALGLSFDEFIALDLIATNEGMCQRDLAKLLFKDRANTGRIASLLEDKEFITIAADTKNKRLVKKLIITDSGKEFIKETIEKTEPKLKSVRENFSEREEETLIGMLKKCRKILDKLVENQI